MRPEPLKNIAEIAPYIPGKSSPDKSRCYYKLSSNENPLGCSPLARQAYLEAVKSLATYPSGGADDLCQAIANRYGLSVSQIICGAGSDEIFQLLARAFLAPSDEVIQSEYGFLVYRLVVQQSGAKLINIQEPDLRADVDAILAAITPRTKMIFLANPNNPTGSYLPYSEVLRLHAGIPDSVLLVLDCAYAEYVRKNNYASGIELVSKAQNVIMTRTFSKIHGLAALRLGWAYGSEHVIDALHKVRGPFNVNAPAQAAGIAALSDREFIEKSAELNNTELEKLGIALTNLGIQVFPSVGNFLLVKFGESGGEESNQAEAILERNGVIVRSVKAYGLDNYLRISIGDEVANQAVISALSEYAGQNA